MGDRSSSFRKGADKGPEEIRKATTGLLYNSFSENLMDLSRTWRYKDLGNLKTENKEFTDLYKEVSNIVNVNEYDNDRYSHACVVRRLVEEDIIEPENILQIGIRAATEEQMEFTRKNNIKMITPGKIYNRIKFRTNFEKAYLSFDLMFWTLPMHRKLGILNQEDYQRESLWR